MQTLKKFVTPRGALTAAAKHIGVLPSTVMRWSLGVWTPSAENQQRVDAMLSMFIFDVSAKKLKKVTNGFSEVKTRRKSNGSKFAAK